MKLEQVELTARLCKRCPKMCRHVCTTHTVSRRETDTPNERCAIAYRALERGKFLPVEVPLMFEKCANCGLCLTWCESNLDVGPVMLAARADIVDQGLAPLAALAANANVIAQGNPWGEPREQRFHMLSGEADFRPITALPEKAETLYFIGCETLYRQPEIAQAALRVFKAAGIDFTVLRDEVCCGEPQYLLGFWDAAGETARQNAARIAASGAKRVVFNCPSCLRIFKKEYPEWGAALPEGIELLHLTEFLAQLLADGRLALRHEISRRIAYHDPCELGRRQGVYDAPRALLAAMPGADFQELQLHHAQANCCGAGGGLGATNLPLVIEASKKVVRMAENASADVLATACPTCKQAFTRHTNRRDIETLDVVELLAQAIG